MSGLRLDGIVKRYGRQTILDGVSLDVRPGEFLVLLGPSGCGKSSLLRVIAGLEAQDGGTVSIGGRNVDDVRPALRNVAMVFQSYALYPHLTIFENVALPLRMRRMTTLQRLPLVGKLMPGARALEQAFRREVTAVATLLEIEKLLGRKPGQLSGGQQQRVALGRAMINHPAVFLMDEPLSNLDAKLRVSMRAEIVALHRRLGVTFVYVTHDQVEAMTMADRVAVMSGGKVAQIGRPCDLYDRPASLEVAGFVGSPAINTLAAELWPQGAVSPAARWLGFRPEAASLIAGNMPGEIVGTIARIENLGADLHVHVVLRDASESQVLLRLERGAGWEPGQAVCVRPDPARLLAFGADGALLEAA